METITLPPHGTRSFPGLLLDSYSEDLPTPEGQLGDRASHQAFDAILESWRAKLREGGIQDPFGETPSGEVDRDALDAVLAEGAPEAAGLVQGAMEDFARNLVSVVGRFLALPAWEGTQRILVGGGFRSARVGEITVGRAALLLRAEGVPVELTPIRHDPDEAGLIGAAHLVPAPLLAAGDAILAADLGGTSFRAGVVLPRLGVAGDLAQAGVWRSAVWRHGEEDAADRSAAIGRLAALLSDLAGAAAGAGLRLSPVVAVGAPGEVTEDGRIARGADNLPGDWHGLHFRLPEVLARRLPKVGEELPTVLLHNDAVLQGLGEAPFQRDVARWGVLTIGTGLGNARFTNRAEE